MTGGLPRKPSGAFAKWSHEKLSSEVRINDVPGARVSRTTRGVSIETDGRKSTSGGGKVRKYVITDASQPDYFVCRSIDSEGVVGEDDVNIGKPLHLRKSTFDAKIHEVECEIYDNESEIPEEALTTETRTYGYVYKSATLRVKSDLTDFASVGDLESMEDLAALDEDDQPLYSEEDLADIVEEVQIVIPRFVPAVIVDDAITNDASTMLYAISCPSFTATPNATEEVPEPEDVTITKVALNDSWAWASI